MRLKYLLIFITLFQIKSDQLISDNIYEVVDEDWLKNNNDPNLCALILNYEYKTIIQTQEVVVDKTNIQNITIGGVKKDFKEYSCGVFKITTKDENDETKEYILYLNNLNSRKIKGSGHSMIVGFLNPTKIYSFEVLCYKRGNKYLWTDSSRLFCNCKILEHCNFGDYEYDFIDVSCMFQDCILLKYLDTSRIITDNIESCGLFLFGCDKLEKIKFLQNGTKTKNLKRASGCFDGCVNLKEIEGLEYLDTSNTSDLLFMFKFCKSLESLDLSNFNTAKVEIFISMFDGCENLKELKGLEKWDTSNAEIMDFMFSGLKNLDNLDISNFKLNKIADKINKLILNSNIKELTINKEIIEKQQDLLENCNIGKINIVDTDKKIITFTDINDFKNKFLSNPKNNIDTKDIDQNGGSCCFRCCISCCKCCG